MSFGNQPRHRTLGDGHTRVNVFGRTMDSCRGVPCGSRTTKARLQDFLAEGVDCVDSAPTSAPSSSTRIRPLAARVPPGPRSREAFAGSRSRLHLKQADRAPPLAVCSEEATGDRRLFQDPDKDRRPPSSRASVRPPRGLRESLPATRILPAPRQNFLCPPETCCRAPPEQSSGNGEMTFDHGASSKVSGTMQAGPVR